MTGVQSTNEKKIALSLFTGAGGMDIGVIRAGFEVIAALELDPYCCETLRAAVTRENRSTHILETDVRTVNPEKLMNDLSLKAGDLALLFGGPPCQAFSQIGKQKGLADERGLLLFELARYASVFQPQTVFIEQVTGLLNAKGTHGQRGEAFEMLIGDLEQLGYTPKWQVINAADYGVPQLRKRVFIVATKAELGNTTPGRETPFRFPGPTHVPADQFLFGEMKPYVTVGDVIADLPEPAAKNDPPRADSHVDVTPAGDRKRIHGVPEGGYLAAQTHLPKEQIKNLTKKDTTKFLRTSRQALSKTLRCGEIFFHPLQDRYLTPREYMRIHSFPDDYQLRGPIRGRSGRVRNLDQYRQIANSVPPKVAYAIAQKIYEKLSCQKSLNFSVTD